MTEVLPSAVRLVSPFRRRLTDGSSETRRSRSICAALRVDEAEAATVSALDAAIIADNPFLRIIHGKGTGAVRERVHALLNGDRRIARYGLAPANQGGSGATVVEFRS